MSAEVQRLKCGGFHVCVRESIPNGFRNHICSIEKGKRGGWVVFDGSRQDDCVVADMNAAYEFFKMAACSANAHLAEAGSTMLDMLAIVQERQAAADKVNVARGGEVVL